MIFFRWILHSPHLRLLPKFLSENLYSYYYVVIIEVINI